MNGQRTRSTASDPSPADFIIDDPPASVAGQLDDDRAVQNCLETAIERMHEWLPDHIRDKLTLKWGIRPETIEQPACQWHSSLREPGSPDVGIGWLPANNTIVETLLDEGFHPLTIVRSGLASSYALNYVYHYEPDIENDRVYRHMPEPLKTLAQRRYDDEIEAREIDLRRVYEYVTDVDEFSLTNWWEDRIIFPYLGESGNARYIIGRRTQNTDDFGAKYAKLTVKRPYINTNVIGEPIYGTWSVEPDEQLILTEGITDAIAAHQNGYSCISPVTKQFKKKHRDPLLEHCKRAGDVIILNDSEQSGEGPRGAVKTALYLEENGIDIRLGMLPRPPSAEKVDLAEFLRTHPPDRLDDVIGSGVTPENFPAYHELSERERRKARGLEVQNEYERTEHSTGSTGSGDSSRSGLFDLTLEDVVTYKEGRYEHNPLEKEGNSASEYFVIYRESGTLRAYSHKSKTGYNAMIWLAVESGTRSSEHPEGKFSDEEIFEIWKHAKQEGYLPSDDPVPAKGIWHIARKHDLAPSSMIPSSWDDSQLPPTIYNRVLEAIEQREGVNPGRDHLDT